MSFNNVSGADPWENGYQPNAYNPGGTDYGDPNWATRFVWSGFVEGIYTGYDVAMNPDRGHYYFTDPRRVYGERHLNFLADAGARALAEIRNRNEMERDAEAVRNGHMDGSEYGAKYGQEAEFFYVFKDWYGGTGDYMDSEFLGYKLRLVSTGEEVWNNLETYLEVWKFEEINEDNIKGLWVRMYAYPSNEDEATYSEFNWIMTIHTNVLQGPFEKSSPFNNDPGDGRPTYKETEFSKWFQVTHHFGNSGTRDINPDSPSTIWWIAEVSFVGLKSNEWVPLVTANYAWEFSNGKFTTYYPSYPTAPTDWHLNSFKNPEQW